MKTLTGVARVAAITIAAALGIIGALRLSGQVRYLVTNGVSMTPLYHSGDLVVARSSSHYSVGQIVAYHSRILHTTVLHRIVTISGGVYTFKGDHNTWTDPEHPTASQLIGQAWLHIPHGGVLLAFHGVLLILLAVVAVAGIVFLPHAHPARTAKRTRPVKGALHRRVSAGLVGAEVLLGVGLAASFALSGHDGIARQPSIRETSSFTYAARVAPNPVYPTGAVATGDPVFVRVVPSITIGYHYQASGAQAAELNGTTKLSMTLSSPNGWHSTVALGTPVAVTAGQAQTSADLDLARLEATLDKVRKLTGVDTGPVNLDIHATTDVSGPDAISHNLDVPLKLVLSPSQLSSSTTSSIPSGAPIVSTKILPGHSPAAKKANLTRTIARDARIPLIIVILLLTVALLLHFYPTQPEPEPRQPERRVLPEGEPPSGAVKEPSANGASLG